MKYDISFASLVLSPDQKYAVIAGGEIYGHGAKKDDQVYLTINMNTYEMDKIEHNFQLKIFN